MFCNGHVIFCSLGNSLQNFGLHPEQFAQNQNQYHQNTMCCHAQNAHGNRPNLLSSTIETQTGSSMKNIHIDDRAKVNYNQNCSWSGYYVQDGKKNRMNLANLRISSNGNISGAGGDVNGDFIIEGQLNQGNTFEFHKTYSAGWIVTYEGNMDGNTMKGLWSLPGQVQEDFEITMDDKVE